MKAAEKDMYSGAPQFSHADMYNKSANMWSGFGKAAMGLLGAFTNKEFQAGLATSLGLGALSIVAAPAVATIAPKATLGIGAYGTMKAVENIADTIDPGPPSTPLGYGVEATQRAIDRIRD